MTAVVESLSRAAEISAVPDAPTPFFKYAQTYWWRHTTQPSPDEQDELGLHAIFLKLLEENAPGLVFPWDLTKMTPPLSIVQWAILYNHHRLLFKLLCETDNSADRSQVLRHFSDVSMP